MIGETLSHYRIVARLGSGAMGDVYRAEDQRLRRPVALKLVRMQGDANDAGAAENASRRLLAEARAASALTHPNIAVVYEVDEVERDGVHIGFIAMEYVSGRTVADSLPRSLCRSTRFSTSGGRRPMPSPTPTRSASCTATSSRRTSW